MAKTLTIRTASLLALILAGIILPGVGLRPAHAALVLKKTENRTIASPGDLVTYTLTLQNAGVNPEPAVVVEDPIPAGTEYVVGSAIGPIDAATGKLEPGSSITFGGATPNGVVPGNFPPYPSQITVDAAIPKVDWNLGTVPGNTTYIMRFQVYLSLGPNPAPPAPGSTITNTATALQNGAAVTTDQTTLTTPAQASPSITKVPAKRLILAGDTLYYYLVASNPTAAAVNATITDNLTAAGLSPVAGTTTLGTNSTNGTPQGDPAGGAYNQAVTIPAGGYMVLAFEAQTQAPPALQGGADVDNSATLTPAGFAAVTDVGQTLVGALDFQKVVDKPFATTGQVASQQGEVLSYILTIGNPTDSDLLSDPRTPTQTPLAGILDTLAPNEYYVTGSAQGEADIYYSSQGAGGPFNYLPGTGLNPYGTDPNVRAIFFSLHSVLAHTADETFSFEARVAPNPPANPGSSLVNQATAQGTLGDAAHTLVSNGQPALNGYTQGPESATTTVSQILLDKSVDKSAALPGEQLIYTIHVIDNAGPVTVADQADPNVTFGAGDTLTIDGAATGATYAQLTGAGIPIAQGDHTIVFSVHINANTPLGTVIKNTAAATDNAQPPSPVTSQTTQTLVEGLQLIKSVDKQTVQVGGTLNYVIEVDNPTGSTLNNVVVTDNIPTSATTGTAYVVGSAVAGPADNIAFTKGAALPGAYNDAIGTTDSTVHSINWTFNSLPPLSGPYYLRFSVQVDQKAPPATVISNQAAGQFQLAGGAPLNTTSNTTLTAVTLLEFHKTVDKAVILPGDVLTYSLMYTNVATVDDPNTPPPGQVTVRDRLGPGQTYIPNSLMIDGVSIDALNPPNPGSVLFFSTGYPLPPNLQPNPNGQTHIITYQVQTDPTALAGRTFTNQAVLTPTGPALYGTTPIVSEPTSVVVGRFDIKKTVDQGVSPAGGTFTITVDNPTDTDLEVQPGPPVDRGGALLSDVIDPNLTVMAVTSPGGITPTYYTTVTPPATAGQLPTFTGVTPAAANARAIQWRFSLPAHSDPVTFKIQVGWNGAPPAGTEATNGAWAQPAYPDPLQPNNQNAEVIGGPTFSNTVDLYFAAGTGINFLKSHTVMGVQLGTPPGSEAYPEQQINYALNFTIPAGGAPNYMLTVIDPIPAGAYFVPGTATLTVNNPPNGAPGVTTQYSRDHGATWGYTPAAGADGTDHLVTDVRWIAAIAGQTNAVTGTGALSVKVAGDAANGMIIRNQAELNTEADTGAGSGGSNFASSTPDMVVVTRGSLTKTVNRSQAQDGDELIYQINYNFGQALPPGNGQPIYIQDTIPSGTGYLVGSAAPNPSGAGAVQFSKDNGATWNYTPVADVMGVDNLVTRIRWDVTKFVNAPSIGHVSFAVRVNAAAADNQIVTNVATATITQAAGTTTLLKSNPVVTQLQGLLLLKSVDQATTDPGQPLNYTLQYSNGLPETLTHAIVYDTIPANTAYVVGSAYGANIQFLDNTGTAITPTPNVGNTDTRVMTIVWRLGDLASGGSGTVGFSVQVSPNAAIGTIIRNQGWIDSQIVGVEPRPSNPVQTAVWPLHVVKSVDKTKAPPGGTLTYTLDYSEHGKVDAANVIVMDHIPTDTAYVVGSASTTPATPLPPDYSNDNGKTWNYIPVADANGLDLNVTDVRWQLGTVTAGNSGVVSFQVQILPDTPLETKIPNVAFETSGVGAVKTPPQGYPSNVVETLVSLSDLTKSVDLPYALPGEVLHYTLTLSNLSAQLKMASQQTLTNVVVVDKIPDNTLFVDGSAAPVILKNGAVIEPEYSTDGMMWTTAPPATETNGLNTTFPLYLRWVFPSIPPSLLPIQMSFDVHIDDGITPAAPPAPADGTEIVNLAHVSSDQEQQFDSNPAITIITHLLNRKTVDKTSAVPGDILGYRLHWENRSPSALNQAEILDPIPANTALVIGMNGAPTVNAPPDIAAGAVLTATPNKVEYSNDGGATWTYKPAANANGVDPAVTDVRILLDVTDPLNDTQGSLAMGESGDATFQVRVNTDDATTTPPTVAPVFGTIITNISFLMSPMSGPMNAVSIPSNPADTLITPFELVKTVDKGNTVLPPNAVNGDILTYTVTALDIINADDPTLNGPLTNVQVEDPIPGGTQYIVGSAAPIANGTVAFSNDGGVTFTYTPVGAVGTVDPNVNAIQWTWTEIDPFQSSGNEGIFKVKIIPPATNPAGTNLKITNQAFGVATFQAGGTPPPPAEQIGPIFSNPVTTLVGLTFFSKSVNRGLFVTPGDVLTYTLLFQNFATQALNNVIVVDTLPTGLTIEGVTINGAVDPRATFDPKTNTAIFKLGTVAPGTPYRLQIKALIPASTPLGTELDDTAIASYDGLLEDLDSNTTKNIVVAAVAAGSDADWSAFHHEEFHTGLDPDMGQGNLSQQWTFTAQSSVDVTGGSFVGSPIVVRNVPLADLDDTADPNTANVARETLEFIGSTDGTTGTFYGLIADSLGPTTQNAWFSPVQFDLPVETTAAEAVGPIGASLTLDKNGNPILDANKNPEISYLHKTRWCVVVGLGHNDPQNGPTGTGALVCLDGSNGTQIWRADLPAPVLSSPIIVKNLSVHLLFRNPKDVFTSLPAQVITNVVYVGCADGFIYAYNLSGSLSPDNDGSIEAQLLWRTKASSGFNLGSPAAIGSTQVVFGQQIPLPNQTSLFNDSLHAVSDDAQTDAAGNPLDAAGNPANPWGVNSAGDPTNDFPVPVDGWTTAISATPDSALLTQSPMVDNTDPVGPVVHMADERRLIALDGAAGTQLFTFTPATIASITSTPAVAHLPDPTSVTAPPLTMVYFASNDTAGGTTFNNVIYGLKFDRTNGYTQAFRNVIDTEPPNGATAFNGTLPVTSSVAAAVDPNNGGMVYVATSTGKGGGRVVSYDALTGATTGPLAGAPNAAYVLRDNLPGDSDPDETASLALVTVPGSDRPWVFGATLGGTAYALGVLGAGGFLPGQGPPGVNVLKTWGLSNFSDTNITRPAGTVLKGDRLDCLIQFGNTGYSSQTTATAGGGTFTPLQGLVVVDEIPNGTSYIPGTATSIDLIDTLTPGSPERWIIPQLTLGANNRIEQVIWDFRNSVDQFGQPAGPVSLPGGELLRTTLSLNVNGANVVLGPGGSITVSACPTTTNPPGTPTNRFAYGDQMFVKATGLQVIPSNPPTPPIQNIVTMYAANATDPISANYITIPDPDGPSGAPANPIGGVAAFPVTPLLPNAPQDYPPGTIVPEPPNLAPPPLPTGLYRPGLYPGSPGHPQFYASSSFLVDNTAADTQVFFRMMRYNPAQPAFTPDQYPLDQDLQRYQLVWEPGEQWRPQGPGYIRSGRLIADGAGTYTAFPQNTRGREEQAYTIDTRDPNLSPGGTSSGDRVNGALSPSPLLPNETYRLEIWSVAKSVDPQSGARMGFVGASPDFSVNNPIAVATGNQAFLPASEKPDANGNLIQGGAPPIPSTVIEVGSVSHNHTSQPQGFVVWDTSQLYRLKPSTINRGTTLTRGFPYRKYATLDVRVARPDRVLPQPAALHFNYDGTLVPPANAASNLQFNPNPNWHPDPWYNPLTTDTLLNPLKNPDGTLFRVHDFMDGYGNVLPNGLSTNQYHWDVNTGRYLFDPGTTDPILTGGHYLTWSSLTAAAPTGLGLAAPQAKQVFDQDYPAIPGSSERWNIAGADPTVSQAGLPNGTQNANDTNPCQPLPALQNPVSSQYSVQVPIYQPDNDLSPNGHNDNNNAAVVNNDWFGYLGRAYVYAQVIAGENGLRVFDPVLSAPDLYGLQILVNKNPRFNISPNNKLNTYEEPYRAVDVHNEVPADLNFNYKEQSINLKQYPAGSSDLAQQNSASANTPNTAWSAFDVENHGNVNLVAVAPWHYDNATQSWHLLGTLPGFNNAERPFFSDNLFGPGELGQVPITSHLYLPRTMIWWSMKRRGFNGGNDRAYVGKLPKAQAGAPFPTTLSRGTFDPNNPDLPADFFPWIGIDLPVGQPVGSYANPNIRLREPSPNRQVVVQNGQAVIVPPDRLGNPDPNAQMNTPGDQVDALPNGGIGVVHPVASAATLNLTADIEESEPATVPITPAGFNASGFTQAGTTNDQVGNDDSPAMVVQSISGNGPPGITENATAMFLYWSSNRANPTIPAPFSANMTIPYDLATGTFASTFGLPADPTAAIWAAPTGLAANAVSVGVIPQPGASPNAPSPPPNPPYPASPLPPYPILDLPPGMSSGVPAYLTYSDSSGNLIGQNLANGGTSRLLPPSPYTQGPRLVLENLNRYDEVTKRPQILGVVAFGDLNGQYTLDYTPLNPINAARLQPYSLITPAALSNPRDPSAMHMIGLPTTYLEPPGTEVQYGTGGEDYEAIGYVGTSKVDRRTSIYANRYIRTASPPKGPPIAGLDPAGAAWPRVGLSVPLRESRVNDPAHGETLLKDASGLIWSSRNLGWLMPMPPVPPNQAQPYPAYTANPDYFRDWPQLMLFDGATNAFVSGLTPPLAPNTWLYDSKNQIWLLQDPAKKLLLTLDANSGQVRLAAGLPALGNGDPQVLRADYTPLSLRLTDAAQADVSPVILMDDSPDNLAHLTSVSAAGSQWATVARHTMWVVFRRNDAGAPPASTLFYTGYRLQVNLPVHLLINPRTNLPDIQVYSAPGGVQGAIIPANHWGINLKNNYIWFDSTVENADVQITMNTTGTPVTFNTTVGWQQTSVDSSAVETPVRIQGVVNEGQPNAFIETVAIPLVDPTFGLPLDTNGQATTANVNPFLYTYSKLWIFWSSTRTGTGGPNARPNTDLFYESIVPQL